MDANAERAGLVMTRPKVMTTHWFPDGAVRCKASDRLTLIAPGADTYPWCTRHSEKRGGGFRC